LYVDASGQVLDGDSAAGLSFARSVITANPSNSTESAVLQFRRGTTAPSSGDLGSIRFTDLSNYRGASIAASIESAWSAGVSHPSFLSFRTTNSGNTTESEKLRLTSDGKLGLGTSSPSQLFTVNGTGGGSFTSGYTNALARINATTNTAGEGAAIALTAIATKETAWIIAAEHTSGNNGDLAFYAYPGGAGYAERLRITAAGNVGIGTTAVDTTLHIQGANTLGRGQLYIQSTSGNFPRFVLGDSADATYLDVYADTSNQEVIRNTGSGGKHVWQINSSEAARIDSSRRLLVGTSTARTPQTYTNPLLQVESTSYTTSSASFIVNQNSNDDPSITLGKSRGTALGSNTVVQSGDALGTITFQGADGSGLIRGAAISAAVDGTPGANDMPGRLVFSTTADGASSPTERMRINSAGNIITTGTFVDPAITGTILEDVFTITDGAAFEVDPGNGSIQLITLGASRTPKATNFAAGESITLMVNDGTAYTLTWTDATWGASGVAWTGGSAPTLATTGYTVLQFWKVSTQVYGAYVGDVA
jgi:hypothetical protein